MQKSWLFVDSNVLGFFAVSFLKYFRILNTNHGDVIHYAIVVTC